MILTKYVFNLGVRLTKFSVIVESVTLRFYCIPVILCLPMLEEHPGSSFGRLDIVLAARTLFENAADGFR